MEVLYPRCAGLDVHSRCVNACVRIAAGRKVTTEHREFATTTAGLLELAAWLTEAGCTHVAMEATGVYWKPVWHVLEDEESFTLVLANAQHIRNVPGRKSDRNDAAWIADLLAHGLIRGSFVPPAPIQELRDLTRTRKQLVREITRHTQRLQKTLEDANVKLTHVVTDILGVSGRAILAALIAGETDPERLADCTTGRLKADRADIIAAVHGRVTAHHRFLLELHLGQIDALRAAVQKLEQQADEVLRPFREAAERLTTIPGVSETVARVLVAEIGVDMTRFPGPGHLVSWAGLCPRLDESAGKRRSTRIRHATPWLKTTLVQAAWAATRKNGSYLQTQFRRLKGRRGPKKAIVAVAASMLTAAYFMLRDETDYHDLGGRYLANRDKHRVTQRLGVEVEVKAAAVCTTLEWRSKRRPPESVVTNVSFSVEHGRHPGRQRPTAILAALTAAARYRQAYALYPHPEVDAGAALRCLGLAPGTSGLVGGTVPAPRRECGEAPLLIRHATPWLKTTLVQAAWAATRKNGSYLQTQFRRLKGRRGPKKAIVAVAASMRPLLTSCSATRRTTTTSAAGTAATSTASQRLLRRFICRWFPHDMLLDVPDEIRPSYLVESGDLMMLWWRSTGST